ncbi:Reverse transcriptase (RNAdependent DNA polymerase) [Acanthamoeba castellanii str. Neff]|uniref:Reverse transcriptase (RNAdependent DNA polymerase) n=1 Tax=Acanthamoeba castellanii (strain ATCC 30010 / Neff) TaxID=1257118 RepID=L8GGX1_ACACF|nr:Reverse transcriptase (RNAdependent DNA polymerase) [Acanthamoeba castellanii str. Neff]ELR11993.1 Reverse transcriptase (RNAdependent DNA polymerase) [Acanthamoeba castellanii str. Neff]
MILNLEVHQMDVENAFLNATLSVHIYIEQPQGFLNLERPDHVCLLCKSLYGLHQALLEWNRMMDRHLCSHHFLPTHTNPCIYVLQESSALVIITVYINDCVIVAPLEHVEHTKTVLHDSFRMKDLGQARSILGMEVMCDCEEGALYLCQAGKIMEILHNFSMANVKSISTPMDPGLILHKLNVTAPGHLRKPYQSVVGRLSYLSQAMCLDIVFTVNVLSCHVNSYNQSHWGAIKHILQYLRTTKDLAINLAACYQ